MGEFYRTELLPELAEKRYGSTEKQGQVVEDALDLFVDDEGEGEDIVGMIEDIHAAVASGQSAHTQSSKSSSTGDEEEGVVAELERRAAEAETIDPEEFDLEVIKGGKGVDRPAIVAQAVLSTDTSLDSASIKDFVRREAGYSPNAARDIAQEALWELEDDLLTPIPDSEWVDKQVERDIENEYHLSSQGADVGYKPSVYRRKMGGSLEDYMGVSNRFEIDTGPFASEEEAADSVYQVMRVVAHQQENGSGDYPYRCRAVLREVWSRVQDEGLSMARSPDAGLDLMIALSDMELTDVVNGNSDA